MSANRVTVTTRLTPDMNQRLERLCYHLGTNRNSYLVNAIGKAVSQDEMHYKIQTGSDDMFKQLQSVIAGLEQEGEQK